MRILFYSTNSNIYKGENFNIKNFPTMQEQFESLAKKYSKHTFIASSSLPGMFLFDLNENEILNKSNLIQYEKINFQDEKEIARFLSSFNPDVAIASTFFTEPFDWLTAKDALVAEELRTLGIKTYCHPLDLSLDCFDKWKTHQLLEKGNFLCPKAVYVHHELFMNAGNRKEILSNVYKDATLFQIKKLNFPVVVKDTTGLSSYGMDVLENFFEVKDFLKSKRFTSDRIIEEFIKGKQAGVEIHGTKNNYTVFEPYLFSVNKYGITSPKQSVKAGPLKNENYKLDELNQTLLKLADFCEFEGIAQIDLVFDGKNWFILEINPRLSGMTKCYCAQKEKSLHELIFDSTFLSEQNQQNENQKIKKQKSNFVIDIKFPHLDEEEIQKLKKLAFVKHIYQIQNKAAKQIREQGFLEIIFTGKTKSELKENLEILKNVFPQKMESTFYKNAHYLIEDL